MKANGYGRIVNVASVAAKEAAVFGNKCLCGIQGRRNRADKGSCQEGAPYGVACNGVCPSLTMTPMTANMGERKRQRRLSQPFLWDEAHSREKLQIWFCSTASDLASFATGEISDVDGGVTMDG